MSVSSAISRCKVESPYMYLNATECLFISLLCKFFESSNEIGGSGL